jgi:DNA polymerase I-like protein with 3'-5' exonuclease and polymerase domains
MIRYAASDVLDTAALPRVLPQPDPAVAARERVVQAMCSHVTHRGLRLDGDHVHAMLASHREAKAVAAVKVAAAGIDNPGSALQVAAVMAALGVQLPRTPPSQKFPEGQPSAAESALLPVQAAGGPAGELAADVLEYRDHATVLNLILEPFGAQVDHGDGRVRPTVYTLGADTGRMSCVRPNLQQLSREGGVRACITADEGMLLISADFQAVELRTAAALAGDGDLYQMITAGDAERAAGRDGKDHDLHWKIARQVWGPGATKGHRYNAKRGVFGRLYGSGVPGIAKTLGISLAEAQAVADTLDAFAPGVARWSAAMRKYVKDGGASFQAYSGRTIWLDRRQPHKSGNYCIQGTAREFLADGLLRWRQAPWGNSVIMPVHDEVLAVVPAAEAAQATAMLVACMQTELNGMPIVAEPSEPSFAWQDAA